MSTREEVKANLMFMSLVFPNWKPDLTSKLNTIDAYHQLLEDIPGDLLEIAVKQSCAEPGRQFAPSAGEIRGAVLNIRKASMNIPTAGEAWQEVMDAIVTGGCHNGTPEYSHPIIKQAVQAIGIVNIGMSENPMVERAHFLKIYDQLLERELSRANELPETTKYLETTSDLVKRLEMKV